MTENTGFDLQEFLPYLLNQAAEESSLVFQQIYKNKYGMLRTEWRVLFHLGLYERMTATDIVARAKIHKTKVSRAVQRLAERRFIRREPSENDRRVEFLRLTSTGIAAYHNLKQVAEEYDAHLVAHFTSEEVQTLRMMLKRLAGSD